MNSCRAQKRGGRGNPHGVQHADLKWRIIGLVEHDGYLLGVYAYLSILQCGLHVRSNWAAQYDVRPKTGSFNMYIEPRALTYSVGSLDVPSWEARRETNWL